MKTLGNLRPHPKASKNRKRLGRGIGSGWGKTAGKGHKGQHARSGGKVRPGFEGGQTPLYRRIPKFGFSRNGLRTEFNIITLTQLDSFQDGSRVDAKSLKGAGLIHDERPIKILANGNLSKKLVCKVHKVSKSAKIAIEKSGGSIEEI